MRYLTRTSGTLCALSLAGLLACGGGSGSPGPDPIPGGGAVTYTNPTSGTYRLVKNGARSRGSLLVLDLVYAGAAPQGARGVGFYLVTDPTRAGWAKVDAADPEFLQKGAITAPDANLLLKSKVASDTLQAAVYQKGQMAPAASLTANAVLATVALNVTTSSPGPITLQAPVGRALLLPADGGTPQTITVEVGALAFGR